MKIHKIEPGRYRFYRKRGRGLGIEWSFRTKPRGEFGVGCYVSYGGYDGDQDSLYVKIGWLQVWFQRDRAEGDHLYDEKQYGFELTTRWWQRWFGNPDKDAEHVYYPWRERMWDSLLGRTVYLEREGRKTNIVVPLPEGEYPAVATFEWRAWCRPRWPFYKMHLYTVVDVPDGIPFSGKGENSWDCGEDGLFGYSVRGHDLAAAAAKGRESVLKTRERRGDPARWPKAPGAAA